MTTFMFDHASETLHFTKNWQQQLAEAFNNIEELCQYLHLSIKDLPVSTEASQTFALRVPLSFAASMQKGNPNDPLLRQVLPLKDELNRAIDFIDDPVGDLAAITQPGVLHKYHGRVLFINTGSCAINCRYCFRRNFPYADSQLSKQHEKNGLEYIATHTDITEVILSGGDPLLLSDTRLKALFEQLNAIKHVKRIRIHTRLPIVLPARMTDSLVKIFTQSRQPVVMVVHCNHAQEINARVQEGFTVLRQAGISVFNQSVLLRGVNDQVAVLSELSETLFNFGVVPYYLHVLDKATGTGHFDVPEAKALELLKELQTRLPGYLVPKLVKEVAGGVSKERLV